MRGTTKTFLPTLILWGVAGALSGAHPQVFNADVADSLEYQQIGPNTVVPFNGGVNAFFYARAFAPVGEFDGGTLTYPGAGSPVNFVGYLLFDCCGHAAVGYQTSYITPANLTAAFPAGDYTLESSNSVTAEAESVTIPYSGSAYAAETPELDAASFTALSSASAVAGLTVGADSWIPVGGTSGQDYFTIYDFTTGMTVVNYHNTPTSPASFYIPAGTLTAGDSYASELIFDDYVESDVPDTAGYLVPVEARSDLRTVYYFTVPTAAPEPSVWTLTLLGFGLLGASLRRRAVNRL